MLELSPYLISSYTTELQKLKTASHSHKNRHVDLGTKAENQDKHMQP